jgi:hypothetical protein
MDADVQGACELRFLLGVIQPGGMGVEFPGSRFRGEPPLLIPEVYYLFLSRSAGKGVFYFIPGQTILDLRPFGTSPCGKLSLIAFFVSSGMAAYL